MTIGCQPDAEADSADVRGSWEERGKERTKGIQEQADGEIISDTVNRIDRAISDTCREPKGITSLLK